MQVIHPERNVDGAPFLGSNSSSSSMIDHEHSRGRERFNINSREERSRSELADESIDDDKVGEGMVKGFFFWEAWARTQTRTMTPRLLSLSIEISRGSLAEDAGGNVDANVEGEGVDEDVDVGVSEVDIPFELVGEVASAGAVAKAGHVKSRSTARHDYSGRADWSVRRKGTDVTAPRNTMMDIDSWSLGRRQYRMRGDKLAGESFDA